MPTLGVPRRHRHLSRVLFYLGVLLLLWLMGRMEPLAGPETLTDEELGVARPYIASPEMPWVATLPQGR